MPLHAGYICKHLTLFLSHFHFHVSSSWLVGCPEVGPEAGGEVPNGSQLEFDYYILILIDGEAWGHFALYACYLLAGLWL